jgi:hypothetical protein
MVYLRKLSFLAAIFVVTACAARPAKANEPPADLCALLPAADVSKTLGANYGDPEKSVAPKPYANSGPGADCRYHAKGSTLWFRAYADPSADAAKNLFAKLGIFYSPKTPVAGLGDEAYFDRDHALHVLKGKVRFYFNLDPINFNATTEKQMKDLASPVIGRL